MLTGKVYMLTGAGQHTQSFAGKVLALFIPMRFRELRIESSPRISDHGVVAPGLVFRWTTHHVREIFSALLPRGYTLDGSSVIQITCGPRGEDPQYHQCLGSSEYYVEDFDFVSYVSGDPARRERVILATVQTALCDIADRVGADKAEVKRAASAVIEHEFRLSTEIPKLRKALRSSGPTVRVIRCLAAHLGETWLARIVRRDGVAIAETVMGESPGYLDRRDYFKAAELISDAYVVRDRLGNEAFRLDVAGFADE